MIYRSPRWLSKKAQDWGQTTDSGGLVAAHWRLWSTEDHSWQKDGNINSLYNHKHQFFSTQHSEHITHGSGLSKEGIQPLTGHLELDFLSENTVFNLTLWKRNLVMWLQMECGLVNRFIYHLRVITTNNYDTVTISTLYSSLEHTV
jgi:hypothetical protein